MERARRDWAAVGPEIRYVHALTPLGDGSEGVQPSERRWFWRGRRGTCCGSTARCIRLRMLCQDNLEAVRSKKNSADYRSAYSQQRIRQYKPGSKGLLGTQAPGINIQTSFHSWGSSSTCPLIWDPARWIMFLKKPKPGINGGKQLSAKVPPIRSWTILPPYTCRSLTANPWGEFCLYCRSAGWEEKDRTIECS